MLERILTGLCLFIAAIPVLIWSDTALLAIVVALLAAIGVFEMLRCFSLQKKYAIALPSYLVAALAPILTRMFDGTKNGAFTLFAVFYAYCFYIFSYTMFSKGKVPFATAAKAIVCTAYVSCGFSCIVATRDLEHGLFLLIMVIVIAFATDIFAYFSGMLFGRHKLIPEVSPKKTVEGAVGGTLIAALAFVGCGLLYSKIYTTAAVKPHVAGLFICGVALSVVAQLGDLIASLIKRECGVKDYGKLFPGHGGVLDRFDSIIAVAPVMYLLLANPAAFSVFR